MTLKLIAALAVASTTPLLAQTPTPTPTPGANALILGSWNSQVEFDAVRVVCGKKIVLDDTFDRQQPGWKPGSGNWQVAGGFLRQSSAATPALTRYPFTCVDSDYTVFARVRKTGGVEGFLIGFGAQDEKNFYWLNVGGWGNKASRLEKTADGVRSTMGPGAEGSIENGRWYVVRIDVRKNKVTCFLDDKKIIETTATPFTLAPDNDIANFGHALIPDMVADPSISEIDGTFYCYATTDGWGQGLATSGTPVVWTSKDFLNWSFEGSSFPDDFDLKYWAPSTIVHKNGRYYSFPTLDGNITAVVADSPTGTFTAPDGQHVTKATLQPYPIPQNSTIDAEVFTDDDGQSYMVWSRRRAAKLKPDLLSPDGPVVNIPTARQGYSEGPFLMKRKGIYYYFYTLGGGENYQYAYQMSRKSPLGPWETPKEDIIATSNPDEKVFGPGHGCFFNVKGTDQWYFVFLEYGRGSTTRQIFANKMNFNADGTIQPITVDKKGVGAVRPNTETSPNFATTAKATASSVRPNFRVALNPAAGQERVETFAPANAIDGANGTRWLAEGRDSNPWFQIDLGAPRDITRTEAYFVKPAAGHAYKLEWSLDGQTWQPYGGHADVIRRSPHKDAKSVRARYLKLTILQGEPGLWEFRVY
jgi:hypothetical protein